MTPGPALSRCSGLHAPDKDTEAEAAPLALARPSTRPSTHPVQCPEAPSTPSPPAHPGPSAASCPLLWPYGTQRCLFIELPRPPGLGILWVESPSLAAAHLDEALPTLLAAAGGTGTGRGRLMPSGPGPPPVRSHPPEAQPGLPPALEAARARKQPSAPSRVVPPSPQRCPLPQLCPFPRAARTGVPPILRIPLWTPSNIKQKIISLLFPKAKPLEKVSNCLSGPVSLASAPHQWLQRPPRTPGPSLWGRHLDLPGRAWLPATRFLFPHLCSGPSAP